MVTLFTGFEVKQLQMQKGASMKFFIRLLLISNVCLANLVTQALGEEQSEINEKYSPFLYFDDDTSLLILAGEIDIRTSLNFKRFILEHGAPDVLLLNSPGGLVHLALDVALEIDQLGIETAIPEDFGCYSACAFMFLAGKNRYADGELGVHQISSENADLYDGQLTLADIIDVLNKFDTPPELFVPMLSTPPEEMYILSDAEISDFGFYGKRAQASKLKNVKPSLSDLEKEALLLVQAMNDAWSGKLDLEPLDVINMYDTEVLYYGNSWSRNQVEADKIAFDARWPVRDYNLVPKRSHVRCGLDNLCTVLGFVEWSAKNPKTGKSASGESQFELIMRHVGDRFYIIKESASVVKRN